MIVQRIQRGKVGSEIDITENEFQAFLATDESLAELQPEILARQILVKTQIEADEVIKRIDNGEDFATIAKELSLSANGGNGGLMQWRKAIDMPKIFADGLDEKNINDITEPLQSGSGFHILKLEEKRGNFVRYEDQWLSRHILLIPSTIRDEDSTENELKEIRLKVENGEDFAELADEYSEDPGSAKKVESLVGLEKVF